jgi:hypothetical protein
MSRSRHFCFAFVEWSWAGGLSQCFALLSRLVPPLRPLRLFWQNPSGVYLQICEPASELERTIEPRAASPPRCDPRRSSNSLAPSSTSYALHRLTILILGSPIFAGRKTLTDRPFEGLLEEKNRPEQNW